MNSVQTESLRRFENYYDGKWSPLHEYFRFHKRRFLDSFEFLDPFVEPGIGIADLVQPGDGPGPLAEFFSIEKRAALLLITSDLREPLEVPDSSCALVLCTETIEHIKDKESNRIVELERFNYSGVDSMLSECARILVPDGLLFITTPNSNSYTNLHKWLMGELPLMDPNHVREYTVDLLNELCAKAGFIPLRVELRNSWGNVSEDQIAAFDRLLESFPAKRDIGRGENIYAIYCKKNHGS
jgi:hypothetical protein